MKFIRFLVFALVGISVNSVAQTLSAIIARPDLKETILLNKVSFSSEVYTDLTSGVNDNCAVNFTLFPGATLEWSQGNGAVVYSFLVSSRIEVDDSSGGLFRYDVLSDDAFGQIFLRQLPNQLWTIEIFLKPENGESINLKYTISSIQII